MSLLEPVHVLEMDRATTKMECTRINPTRSYADLGPYGIVVYTWQNGRWFDQGGNEMPKENVPQEHRDHIAAHPVEVNQRGPSVIAVCEFCGEQMNRSVYDTHLVAHVREHLKAVGSPPPAALPALSHERPKASPRA